MQTLQPLWQAFQYLATFSVKVFIELLIRISPDATYVHYTWSFTVIIKSLALPSLSSPIR